MQVEQPLDLLVIDLPSLRPGCHLPVLAATVTVRFS
jgi:hypothetical protein